MELTVEQIAALVNGRVHGDSHGRIYGVAGLGEATPSDVSFVKDAKNARALQLLESTKAGAIIVPSGIKINGKNFIEVENPLAAFSLVLEKIAGEKKTRRVNGVHPTSFVGSNVKLGKDISIGPFCVIEDDALIDDNVTLIAQVYVGSRSHIGAASVIYPQVILREEVSIGERCVIHAGAVIGSDGYGFYFEKGKHNKIPQIGTVVIEDDVEIGSCTTIDRATTGRTLIKKGTKIDNLVQIAHNVEVGPHALIVAQVGIAGSSKIGQGVVLAGQVGVADHVTIGDGAQVGAQSGLKDDVPAGAILFGSPAQPIQDTIRQMLLIRKLPELFKDVKNLKGK